MIKNNFYALKTQPRLRDDAIDFLNEHKGRFTVLTGAKLPDNVKETLGLNETNCRESLKPEDKKNYAENLIINNTKMPKEKIVAFGDGGNDWGMFHTVNVATQLGDSNEDKIVNFADVFSDVVIPELSDFKILNNIAKNGIKSHKNLRNFGLGVMASGIGISLFNIHYHNPLFHVIHHLGTQLVMDALAHRFSNNVVNTHTLGGVNQSSKQ
jgi:cation transport ATPase